MPKQRTQFVCQQCGAISPGYLGKCPACGEWHTMVETIEERSSSAAAVRKRSGSTLQPLAAITYDAEHRVTVPIGELNRVLGGGLVPGSLVLVGGDPGIGKSTLILQAASMLGSAKRPVVYVSAEESAQQILDYLEERELIPPAN